MRVREGLTFFRNRRKLVGRHLLREHIATRAEHEHKGNERSACRAETHFSAGARPFRSAISHRTHFNILQEDYQEESSVEALEGWCPLQESNLRHQV